MVIIQGTPTLFQLIFVEQLIFVIQFSLRFQGPKFYKKVTNIVSVSIFVSKLKTFPRSDYGNVSAS